MKKTILRVRYRGREVNIVGAINDPENGYLFRLESDSGWPVVPDQKDSSQPGHVSAWACVFASDESADEIFRRLFGLTAEDALIMEIKINPEAALISLVSTNN